MIPDMSPEEAMKAIQETKLLFIDSWAPWCGPCKALTPVLEELDSKYSEDHDIGFIKVNTQDHRGFATKYSIYAIPCVLVFYDGEPASFDFADHRSGEVKKTDRLVGLRPIDHYEKVIAQFK
ncbi:MAG: thioredoxin family protein [Candidatus Thorarchaeota archaeon]